MTEEWKDVEGFEGLYAVSSNGRVKSYAKCGGNGMRDRMLRQQRTRDGYMTVRLSREGHVTDCLVHRLVAHAFCDHRTGAVWVNHKDSNRTHNVAANLEWCTPRENWAHSASKGRQLHTQGLATEAARHAALAKGEARVAALLGNRLVTSFHEGSRRYVTYTCAVCGALTSARADHPRVLSGGTCTRKCALTWKRMKI